jgi:hypothetical protein
MTEWANLWSDITAAVRIQTGVPEDWEIVPKVFVPKQYQENFKAKVNPAWAELKIIALEEVVPWVQPLSPDQA